MTDPAAAPMCEVKNCPHRAIGLVERNGVWWAACEKHAEVGNGVPVGTGQIDRSGTIRNEPCGECDPDRWKRCEALAQGMSGAICEVRLAC